LVILLTNTIGGAIYSNLIAAVRPAVIIVEEAGIAFCFFMFCLFVCLFRYFLFLCLYFILLGEVLEPQLIASISSCTQHLIMIGDHKQLRPPVASYTLAKDHNFDISLLERYEKTHQICIFNLNILYFY
jgi:hypothetical protein